MKISGYAPSYRQPWLFDEPLGNHGHVRTVIGKLMEELTAVYVCGRRHQTTGAAEYCPDVSRERLRVVIDGELELVEPDGLEYFESKAAGRSRQTFIYYGRLAKDCRFAAQHPLQYVIWHHYANTKRADTVRQLQTMVLNTLKYVCVVPFPVIHDHCSRIKPEPLNSHYGKSSNASLYGSGYRIRLSLLQPHAFNGDRFHLAIATVRRSLHGCETSPPHQSQVCDGSCPVDSADGMQVSLLPGAPASSSGIPSPSPSSLVAAEDEPASSLAALPA